MHTSTRVPQALTSAGHMYCDSEWIPGENASESARSHRPYSAATDDTASLPSPDVCTQLSLLLWGWDQLKLAFQNRLFAHMAYLKRNQHNSCDNYTSVYEPGQRRPLIFSWLSISNDRYLWTVLAVNIWFCWKSSKGKRKEDRKEVGWGVGLEGETQALKCLLELDRFAQRQHTLTWEQVVLC